MSGENLEGRTLSANELNSKGIVPTDRTYMGIKIYEDRKNEYIIQRDGYVIKQLEKENTDKR